MSTPNIEGTFYLDGLLEGPVADGTHEEFLRDFVRQIEKARLKFHLAIDGGRFSLLPDSRPAPLPRGYATAESLVQECLEILLRNYPPAELPRLMSTLRSVEYLPQRARQSLYGLLPDGKISIQQRMVPAPTAPPAVPLDLRTRLKWGGLVAGIVALVLAISSFFVPYRAIFGRIYDNIRPFHPEQVQLTAAHFARYFEPKTMIYDGERESLRIECAASGEFPRKPEEFHKKWEAVRGDIYETMALQALARQELRCHAFDRQGKLLSQGGRLITWDPEKPGCFYLFIPYDRTIGKIDILY